MTESEGNGAFAAEIGDPVPGENTFDSDDVVGAIQRYDMLEAFGSGRHVLVIDDRAGVVHDTDIHRSCMQVDAGVELMLFFIESHKGPPVEDLVYPYYRAFMSINCFERTKLLS